MCLILTWESIMLCIFQTDQNLPTVIIRRKSLSLNPFQQCNLIVSGWLNCAKMLPMLHGKPNEEGFKNGHMCLHYCVPHLDFCVLFMPKLNEGWDLRSVNEDMRNISRSHPGLQSACFLNEDNLGTHTHIIPLKIMILITRRCKLQCCSSSFLHIPRSVAHGLAKVWAFDLNKIIIIGDKLIWKRLLTLQK